MELIVGPFDPALHVRSRDHYEAVHREAQLLDLRGEAPPRRLELTERRFRQVVDAQVDPVVDRAYLNHEPSFSARVVVADERAPALLADCDELERLLGELEGWAHQSEPAILQPGEDVKAYRAAFLAQLREQLAVLLRHTEPTR